MIVQTAATNCMLLARVAVACLLVGNFDGRM